MGHRETRLEAIWAASKLRLVQPKILDNFVIALFFFLAGRVDSSRRLFSFRMSAACLASDRKS